jgi:transposase
MPPLSKDDIVSILTLQKLGESNRALARRFGVTENTIRYHKHRSSNPKQDRRKRLSLIDRLGLAPVVDYWWNTTKNLLPEDRAPSGEELWSHLVEDYEYKGSQKSVRKYVRSHFPKAKLRAFRRVETPPGAQTQTDWVECRGIDIGAEEGPVTLYGFVMILSHSRKAAVIWCRSMNQLSWHHAHNLAFARLGGVAAVNRIDNLKTGIIHGAGPWGEINPSYRTYAKTMGFHIDACLPRTPQHKGKTERRCGVVRTLGIERRCFMSLTDLQNWSDEKLRIQADRLRCAATGTTIREAWEAEQPLLRQIPVPMPEPFDLIRSCPVHPDCRVHFEGRTYDIPFPYVGTTIEARGCALVVQFVDPSTGAIIRTYPRGTAERHLLDSTCYEGEATDRVLPPTPLGKMARKLDQISQMEVQMRSVDIYAALAEVAR